MKRKLTVKGVGKISVKPDLIVVKMELSSLRPDYQETMELAAQSVKALQEAIQAVGFTKEDLKTTNFSLDIHYEKAYDHAGNYKSKFVGYLCEQELKLEFAYDLTLLPAVLAAIAQAPVNPQLELKFTVKDKTAVQEKLLVKATENARQKAEILTKAAGVSLGKLLSIDYNWSEIQLYSSTRYIMEDNPYVLAEASVPEIEPDEINVSDAVTFVWELTD
ncbi:MAG: SIMPL domain-containing protein [Firmicutes bacterium]|nr:SIMPL domain-containing protein [Bacillota bacterium]